MVAKAALPILCCMPLNYSLRALEAEAISNSRSLIDPNLSFDDALALKSPTFCLAIPPLDYYSALEKANARVRSYSAFRFSVVHAVSKLVI
jgi:hypothetical protein